jgi:hypothetical protein
VGLSRRIAGAAEGIPGRGVGTVKKEEAAEVRRHILIELDLQAESRLQLPSANGGESQGPAVQVLKKPFALQCGFTDSPPRPGRSAAEAAGHLDGIRHCRIIRRCSVSSKRDCLPSLWSSI